MARDSQRLEQEFIASVAEKTGKSVEQWMDVIQRNGLDKPNAILNWLKSDHKLNHMQANFLSGIYMNEGKPVYDYEVLFSKLFDGKNTLMPTYQALENSIRQQLPDNVEFIPTKAYVSIEGQRCFACATLTRKNIRVGLDLGAVPFDDYVQKAKSLGAMPNLTHMVEIEAAGDVNGRLMDYVKLAYNNTHTK
jgi:hypothetical protein